MQHWKKKPKSKLLHCTVKLVGWKMYTRCQELWTRINASDFPIASWRVGIDDLRSRALIFCLMRHGEEKTYISKEIILRSDKIDENLMLSQVAAHRNENMQECLMQGKAGKCTVYR